MTIIGWIYEHYKGGLYKVIGHGRMEKNLEEVIIYKPLEIDGKFPADLFWVRPRKEWEKGVEINGLMVPRYVLVKTASQVE